MTNILIPIAEKRGSYVVFQCEKFDGETDELEEAALKAAASPIYQIKNGEVQVIDLEAFHWNAKDYLVVVTKKV